MIRKFKFKITQPKPGRIKALVLRRDSDWYGACFGDASAAFRQAAVAAAIDRLNRRIQRIYFT